MKYSKSPPVHLMAWRDPDAWSKASDIVAVLLAMSLPWSTSLVGIFAVVFLLTITPTIDWRAFAILLSSTDLRVSDCADGSGDFGYVVVRRSLERTSLCVEPADQTFGAAAAVLSLRALVAWNVGIHGLSSFVRAPKYRVLAGDAGPEHLDQAGRRRARHIRQELYRSEPGICTLHGRARISHRHVTARKEDRTGATVDYGWGWLHSKHGFRDRFTYCDGDAAGHAGHLFGDFICADGPAQ